MRKINFKNSNIENYYCICECCLKMELLVKVKLNKKVV